MTKNIKGGQGNEPWYKSRRVWGIVFNVIGAVSLSLVAQGVLPEGIYVAFLPIINIVGAYFGFASWTKPKKA